MAGTSIPFFLFPTGQAPFVPAGGGYRNPYPFFLGMAAAVPFTPPPATDVHANPFFVHVGTMMGPR